MLMNATKAATLQQVQLVDIHGTRLYDLIYSHDEEPDVPRRARLGPEALYADPQPGDEVSVRYLMGVVTAVERR
jgi:hypothetical protein